jgi:hypothetical protein
LDYHKLGNCQKEYQVYAMAVPEIKPASFKPSIISEPELSDGS